MDGTELESFDGMNDPRLSLFSKAIDGGMQSLDRLVVLSYLLMQTAEVSGAVIELGTYFGDTAVILASLKPEDKGIWVYDSFQGLSQPGFNDINKPPFIKGAMKSSAEVVRQTFKDANLSVDIIHESPVENLMDKDLPEAISFAHCDVDLYAPTLHVLNLIWPRLSPGGIIVIDDVNHPELPGVAKAVRDFVLADVVNRRLHSQVFGINGQKSLSAWIQK